MNNNKTFEEEKIRLKKVIKLINKYIEESNLKFNEQKHTIIGFKEGQRGTQFVRQALMSQYATEINNLEKIKDNPYFGRFDFKESGKNNETIYIGKKNLFDENMNQIVCDWRTPVCSVFYDYGLGESSYEINGKTKHGETKDKRQIIIKNGELIDVLKQDLMSNDSILSKYLSENSDARLKSIVATIQQGQNKIIRSPMNKNYIVQGVAGSGKTTVALHRISYLLYAYSKNINSDEFLILGPNKYFLDYISAALPDLDINNISQTTIDELSRDILKCKYKFKNKNDLLQDVIKEKVDPEILKKKSSIEFISLVDKFVDDYMKGKLQEPIKYHGITLCDEGDLKRIYELNYTGKCYKERVNDFIKVFSKKIKEDYDSLSEKMWNLNKLEIYKFPVGSKERLEKSKVISDAQKEIKTGCKNVLNEYFNFLKVKPIILYQAFISNLSDEYKDLKNYTLDNLSKKIISDEDLAPLLLIQKKIQGIKQSKDVTHLIIDEAQDVSPAQYFMLKKLFPSCTFDIFGDINQSIYDYQSYDNWDDLNNDLFSGNAILLNLNKTYRTTKQISDVSNYLLEDIGMEKADCISHDGNAVKINFSSGKDLINDIIIQINDLLSEYNSIAIICKDEEESKNVYNKLKKLGININLITENNEKYTNGLSIIPSYLSKGLEFDAVILYNADNLTYKENRQDAKLLYVALTRAMQELIINSSSELSHGLNNFNNEKKHVLLNSNSVKS